MNGRHCRPKSRRNTTNGKVTGVCIRPCAPRQINTRLLIPLFSARADKERYEKQMAEYQPPDKLQNRKRNKTGYNLFFSSHVLRLKTTDHGVPSERGSVARLVGSAWKQLSADEKQYYESEADKHNAMHVHNHKETEDEEVDDEEGKRMPMEAHYHAVVPVHPEMHLHPMHPPYQHVPGHDPRQHPMPMPPPPHGMWFHCPLVEYEL
jgi:hypothetical protein